jgi:hypothetical protein
MHGPLNVTLHHNVNTDRKMHLLMLEAVRFISEIKNHKQRVKNKQIFLARANKKKERLE